MRRSKAILITGMHRSGTSALTRVVNLLGADLGACLLPAVYDDNTQGYWEQRDIVTLNDDCLHHFGRSWNDPRPMPSNWLQDGWLREWKSRADNVLHKHFADSALFVIKDPRISRLLPIWLDAIRQLGADPHLLITLRHPVEVVASLHYRQDNQLDSTMAHHLWLRYLVDVAIGSRGTPRAWVLYDRLLANWHEYLQKLAETLGISWPNPMASIAPAIESFLDQSLRRQHVGQQIIDRDNLAIDASCRAYQDLIDCLEIEANPGDVIDVAARSLRLQLGSADAARPAQHAMQEESTSLLDDTSIPADLGTPSELLRLRSRLYYRTEDSSYSPERSVAVEAQLHDELLIAPFVLPEGAEIDLIRFDPAEMSGIYRLCGIAVNDQPMHLSENAITAVRERRLPCLHRELIRIACSGNDPWIEINLRNLPDTPSRPDRITIQFKRESVIQMVGERVDQQRAELQALQNAQRDELARLQQQVAEAARNAESAQQAAYAGYLAQPGIRTRSQRGSLLRAAPVANGHLQLLAEQPASRLRVWRVAGDDPSFQFDGLPGRKALHCGWHLLSMTLRPLSGLLHQPVLYIDTGGGFKENEAIRLALGNNTDQHRLLVRFENSVRGLRLDPSNRHEACDFIFADPSLKRITHVEAMLRLAIPAVRKMRDQGASWVRIVQEIGTLLRRDSAVLDTLYTNAQVAEGPYGGISYTQWIAANDTLTDADREKIRTDIAAMSNPPVISIILPVYDTPERWLRACLDSVTAQLYPHWQLCIADDASTQPHVRAVLEEFASTDRRIKVEYREQNGHISAASNSALQLASGEYLALLDHDDELPEHALYHIAKAIQAHPEARLIYSDEDKIDESGKRFDPYFKPDWNPELFLGHNMFSHFGVYNRKLVQSEGGFRTGLEGSQDYDLMLRCMEKVDRKNIIHIPKVLYHWRAVSGSTALSPGEKNYAHVAARSAISAHLERTGIHAQVEPLKGQVGTWRIRRKLPEPLPTVSIIIPTRDHSEVLRQCISSVLEKSTYPQFEIIIVDNQSEDTETLAYLDRLSNDKRIRVIQFDEPFNFSRMNNMAAKYARGDVLVFLNNDTEILSPDWLEELIPLAIKPNTGAIGAMLYYPDQRIQHAGIVLGLGEDRIAGHAYHLKHRGYPGDKCRAYLIQEVSAVTAACMAIKRERFETVHGFDEALAVSYNDVDLCLRLKDSGYFCIWNPNAELIHHESLTRGADTDIERRPAFLDACTYMRERWGNRLLEDPYYHPAFSLDRADFMTWVEPRQASSR